MYTYLSELMRIMRNVIHFNIYFSFISWLLYTHTDKTSDLLCENSMQQIMSIMFFVKVLSYGKKYHIVSWKLTNIAEKYIAACRVTSYLFHADMLLGLLYDQEDGDGIFLQNISWFSTEYIVFYWEDGDLRNRWCENLISYIMHLCLFFVSSVSYIELFSYNFADKFMFSQKGIGRVIKAEGIFAYNTNVLTGRCMKCKYEWRYVVQNLFSYSL
jgi:hypothetical protein